MATAVDRQHAEKEMASGVNVQYAEKYGFSDTEDYVFKAEKGLTEVLIRPMSKMTGAPVWLREDG